MASMAVTEIIHGFGHENVLATHHTTLEFLREKHLSKNGDCILVVATDKGLADLSPKFKETLRTPHAKLTVRIEAADFWEEIHAQGSPDLTFMNPLEIVLRKSGYTSDRTLGIHADKAAKDLSRDLVEKLKNPRQQAKITLTVQT